MASVRRRAVVGRHPSSAVRQHGGSASRSSGDHLSSLKKDAWSSGSKPEEFVYYSDSDDEDAAGGAGGGAAGGAEGAGRLLTTSSCFVDYHADRQAGLHTLNRMSLDKRHATKHLLSYSMIRERPLAVGGLNKVFCSAWLSDHQLVFGTKCNKILVYNVRTRRMDNIPMLLSGSLSSTSSASSSTSSVAGEARGGVYSLSVNPSRTLMATCAANCCDLAVYRLPTLDPLSLGQGGHRDWIYGSVWLDDERVVTGGRDSCVTLWRVPSDPTITSSSSTLPAACCHCMLADTTGRLASCRCGREVAPPAPSHVVHEPVLSKRCKTADKVRALAYNARDDSLAALSLNAYVHLFDCGGGGGGSFRQRMSRRLPHSIDNVCLAMSCGGQVYAVGSKSHTTLLEPKSLRVLKKIPAKYHGCGIRSLSFNGDILTIGTGNSVVMFYDLRAQKYLDSAISSGKAVVFKAASGWTTWRTHLHQQPALFGAVADVDDAGGGVGGRGRGLVGGGGMHVDHTPAIYTHCYDESGTRLFTAGGPLSVDVNGCYAGIWM